MINCVGIVLVKENSEVLAQLRDNNPEIIGPNTWCVVAGVKEKVDLSLKDAAIRELKEETGYIIKHSDLKPLSEDEYTNERGVKVHRTIFWAFYDGIQEIKTFEGQLITFITLSNIPDDKFYPKQKDFLELAIATSSKFL